MSDLGELSLSIQRKRTCVIHACLRRVFSVHPVDVTKIIEGLFRGVLFPSVLVPLVSVEVPRVTVSEYLWTTFSLNCIGGDGDNSFFLAAADVDDEAQSHRYRCHRHLSPMAFYENPSCPCCRFGDDVFGDILASDPSLPLSRVP